MTNRADTFNTTEDGDIEERLSSHSVCPFLFVVLHSDQPALGGARYNISNVNVIEIGRASERSATRLQEGAIQKLDLRLPSTTISKAHARIVRKAESFLFEDLGSRNGSFVNGQRVSSAILRDGDFIEVGRVFLRFRAAMPTSANTASDLDLAEPGLPGFTTLVPPLADEFRGLERIARTPITMLLLGESGTGKDVLVNCIHSLSGRTGAFVPVNCGALTSSLLESQLFGHVKGAFTGAIRDEPGFIRRADGGTLFLDEIGDLPLSAQATLLRVLEAKEVFPVGGTMPIKVNLRIVAATHKQLERMTIRGEFRVDLLARLSGHEHTLTPLRDRLEDMGLLMGDLLRRSDVPLAGELSISAQAARWLLSQRWPLNIRELSQVLGVAAALADGKVIERAFLPEKNALSSSLAPQPDEEPPSQDDLRGRIVALLEKHHGNVSHVARDMGKARVQIHRWMQKLAIDVEDYRH